MTRAEALLTMVSRFRATARLLRDRRGVAAVEFAMILPVMLLLYIGIIDVSRGVIASRKLNLLSRTISDLVSQQPTTNAVPIATLSNIFTAAAAIMQPYGSTGLTMTVSAVDIRVKSDNKTCCDAVVHWTYTQGGQLRPCGAAAGASGGTTLTQVPNGTKPAVSNIPSSVITANQSAGYNYVGGQTSYIIITDATYTYKPIFSQAVAWFSQGMAKTTYMVPRSPSGAVTIANPSSAPSGQSGTICF